MQRRAVAVSVAFFLLLGAASYALIATAEAPTVTLEDPEYELSQNETFTVADRTYTVTAIEGTEDEETGETTYSGTIEWVEPNVEMSATWSNEDTVDYQGDQWQVLIEGENATSFTLQEVIDRQTILENDPDARNETVTSGGQEFVVLETGSGQEFVPAEEYFPTPATQTFAEGDTLQYNNQTTTVSDISGGSVTLTWVANETNSEEVTHESMLELADGNQYLFFFPGEGTVQVTQDTSSYEAQIEETQQFSERIEGLQYVMVVVIGIALSLIAFAFLPTRY